jgi:L-lactate dehydrogenase complex protein LldE
LRAALFIPCFIDQLYPEVGKAMVVVLERLGIETFFPSEQTCCGQPAFNTGYRAEARRLARRFCDVFADAEAIVSPSASCTAMVRNYYAELLDETPPVATRSYELSEFLVRKLGITDVGARFAAKATYHDACHALRELKLKDEPRRLLAGVRELELVEMEEAETCCGFGGTFAVKWGDISTAVGRVKVDSILKTGAQCVVSTDMSCLMQIDGILTRRGAAVETLHLAQVLART